MHSKQIEVQGKIFASQAEAARFYGVTYSALESRLRKGWTLEQALYIVPPSGHKSYNLWLRRQGKEERICSKCKQQKPLTDFYKQPKKGKGTHLSVCQECTKLRERIHWRFKSYGITLEQWNKLFISQDKKCAICHSETSGSVYDWNTDHCHKTNKIRGILCKNCNLLIGFARDDISILYAAIEYLKNSRPDIEEMS